METLLHILRSELMAIALPSIRFVLILVISPAFGGRILPARLKLAAAVLFAVIIHPVQGMRIEEPMTVPVLICMGLNECLVGALIGFVSALIFYGIEMSGLCVDTFRGQTLAQVFVPQIGERASQFGQLYVMIATVVFFSTRSYVWIFGSLDASYEIFPASSELPIEILGGASLAYALIGLTARTFEVALTLSAPVICLVWITDWLLGFINRLIPGLQVFDLGLGLKMWLAILIFCLILERIIAGMAHEIAGGHSEILRLLFDKLP